MPLKIKDLFSRLDSIIPFSRQESWDNSGFQCGEPDAELTGTLLGVDITEPMIDEAAAKGCNLIITHHPLIFKPIKQILPGDFTGRILRSLIRKDITLLSLHTNLDKAYYSLFAGRLGWASRPLQVERDIYYKIVVFTPEEFIPGLQEIIRRYGRSFGQYTGCSFRAPGEGSFSASPDADPYAGNSLPDQSIAEWRVEFEVSASLCSAVLGEIDAAHPYEEPVFDIYPLEPRGNEEGETGIGSSTVLERPVSINDILGLIRSELKPEFIKVITRPSFDREERVISRAAICPGSGGSFIKKGLTKGADLFITSDVDYHTAQEAVEAGLSLILLSHFDTEKFFLDKLAEDISNITESTENTLPVFISSSQRITYTVF